MMCRFAALEAEANTAQARTLKISDPETRYCIYMLEKYAQDYKVCDTSPSF